MIAEPLIRALVVAAAGLLSLGSVLMVTFLLSTERGRLTAGLFLLGYWCGYLIVGALGLLLGHRLGDAGWAELAQAIGMTIFGGLFLFFAYKNLRAVLRKEDQEPIALFARFDRMSPGKALMVGAAVTAINFKNLALFLTAVGELGPLPLPYRFASLPLLVATFCAATLVPMAIHLFLPTRSEAWLRALRASLERNGRRISVFLLGGFGLLFLSRGLRVLLARFG